MRLDDNTVTDGISEALPIEDQLLSWYHISQKTTYVYLQKKRNEFPRELVSSAPNSQNICTKNSINMIC